MGPMRIAARRAVIVMTLVAVALLGAVATSAKQPNGLKGYEGQPGNQAGQQGGGQPSGLKGYEGQPGNQGGPKHNP